MILSKKHSRRDPFQNSPRRWDDWNNSFNCKWNRKFEIHASKKNYLIFSFIATPGRAINLLKRKSSSKRQIAKRAKFEIDIGILVDATLEDSFQTDDKNKNEETKDQNELGGSKMNLG